MSLFNFLSVFLSLICQYKYCSQAKSVQILFISDLNQLVFRKRKFPLVFKPFEFF